MTLPQSIASAFRLPDRRPIYTWGEENIRKPAGWTRSFDIQSSRHFIEPFNNIQDAIVRETNIMAPVQSGKSLIAEVSVAYFRANDPGPVLWLFQDDQIAKEYAESRGMKLLKSIAAIRDMLPHDRSLDRKQEIVFSDGHRLVIWGPSLGNLQTFGYRMVLCDELWRWAPGVLKEAKGRLSAWAKMSLDKLVCISQGGAEEDDWDFQWQSGEQRLWNIRCAACNHLMYPHMTAHRPDGSRWGIMFDAVKKENGVDYNLQRAAETVRFECEKCGHAHADTPKTRAAWNFSGEYVTQGETSRTHKSHRWPCWIDSPWAPFVVEFLEAKAKMSRGSFADMILFVQKRLAEPKSEKTVHDGALTFARANPNETWEQGVLRLVTVDKQADGVYWLTARQWAKGTGESRRIMFRKCVGEADVEGAVKECKPSRIRISVNGKAVDVYAVMIDSGYKATGDRGVYSMCARNGWIAARGEPASKCYYHTIRNKVLKDGKWVIESKQIERPYSEFDWADPGEGTETQGRKHCPLVHFSGPTFTDQMQEMIDRKLWVEPTGDEDTEIGREYNRQMNSEWKRKERDRRTGLEFMAWYCPSGQNHARDGGKMQVLGATITQLL